MTTQEAKVILTLYRPNAADAKAPEFAEALALARQDPELKRWLDEHHAVQSVIRERFIGIAVPEGLKEQIVSEHRSRAKVIWWRQPVVWAAAAVVVVLLGIGTIWLRSEQAAVEKSFQTYQKRMVSEVLRRYTMSLVTSDDKQIRSHLAQQNSPDDYVVPESLTHQPLAGCGVLNWQDKRVSMICFRTGKPLAPGQKSDLFLFVVDRGSIGGPPATSPQFAQIKKLATASWSDGNKTYMLATPGVEADLRPFL